MSSAPSSPDPNSKKIPQVSVKQNTPLAEGDLWDLDSELVESKPETESAELPAPRPASGTIRSVQPAELKAQPVAVPSLERPIPGDFPEAQTKEETETTGPYRTIEANPDDAMPSTPLPVRIRVPFTLSEKISVTLLMGALLAAGVLTVLHFSERIATRPLIAGEIDYPVKGRHLQILDAESFWRKPVTSGENTDVVRRGTLLIPVLSMKIDTKPGAVRVFFRDGEGDLVGDVITRTVSGKTDLEIAATAGFDDEGMYTAYRTGNESPWMIQIFEGPDASASRDKFELVLETEISPERR